MRPAKELAALWHCQAAAPKPNSTSTHTETPGELLGSKRGADGAVIKPGSLGHWQVFV